jgi:hypothetical protein
MDLFADYISTEQTNYSDFIFSAFLLSFGRHTGSSQIIAQYYQLIRLGFEVTTNLHYDHAADGIRWAWN